MLHAQSRALPSAGEKRAFVAKKLFSLTGVVPLGTFVALHLWTYASALAGKEHFDERLAYYESSPFLLALEVVLLWLPLLYHAGYGVVLSFKGTSNVSRYPYSRNWSYVLQRASGIVTLLFVGYHFWHFRWPLLTGAMARSDVFSELCAELSSTQAGVPWVAVVYLIGVAATTYHLANGLSLFCFSWGITRSAAGVRRVAAWCGVLGVLLFALGASSVLYFATGSKVVLSLRGVEPERAPLTCSDLDENKALARHASMGTGAR